MPIRKVALLSVSISQKTSYFVDVMTKKQKWQFRSLVGLWLVALGWFWVWWLTPSHIVSLYGILLTSFSLAWTTILPGYFFYFAGKMKMVVPDVEPPAGRYAMVVTKAPSEPWTMVTKTLEAMLTQKFPYRYDVWLATEKRDEEIMVWCSKHNVNISCRDGFEQYQQPTFPHKSRCKEGNLSFFYEKSGGYSYDYVCQLDADHIPTNTYLWEMTKPFADLSVGYVAAPSICDINSKESWIANARLYSDASMHGALQAGRCYDWAPNPIGSHYAVRISALKSLVHQRNGKIVAKGTLGPELAEDHSTGLAMQSTGWRGAFAMNAIAHGDGPASFADAITQEFQWARSLMNILLIWTKGYWKGLRTRPKFDYAFVQLWYPLYALVMLMGCLFPIIALATGMPWNNIPLFEFIVKNLLLTMFSLFVVSFIQKHGWRRPSSAPILSWEMVLFQLVRWPWVLYGCVQSILGVLLHKEFTFKVTPKNYTDAKPLPFKVLLPYVFICVVNIVVTIFIAHPGKAAGYYYFSVLNGLIYIIVLFIVVLLHIKENRVRLNIPLIKYVIKYAGLHLALLLVLGVGVGISLSLRYAVILSVLNYAIFLQQLNDLIHWLV